MFTLNCKGTLLVVDKPIVMGIINVTPDSFYAQSRQENREAVLQQAESMLKEGAAILDIGGQSTRPGSQKVDPGEELERVLPAIEIIQAHFPSAFISIDTYYARVAEQAIHAGASIVNDISAGSLDDQMIPAVASLRVPYVLMHMKGSPQTMQQHQQYENVTREVLDFFIRKKEELQKAGINDLIMDPGFGFAKNASHNFELLRNLPVFRMLKAPLLLGISRKSFVYKSLGLTAEQALEGTIALNMAGLMNGANILRVHDVKAAVQTIKLWQAMQEA